MDTKTIKNNFLVSFSLFKSALEFYRRHFKVILYLLALPIALRVVLEIFRFEGLLVPITIIFIATLLVNLLAQAAFIFLIIDEGKSSAKDYLRQSWRIFWPFVWVTFLTGLAAFAAAILLIIPGIIVAVFLVFSSFLVVIENKRGMDALRASWQSVEGHWWLVFSRLLFLILVLLVAFIVVSIISAPFSGWSFFREVFAAIISGLILSPLGVIYIFSLYRELNGLPKLLQK